MRLSSSERMVLAALQLQALDNEEIHRRTGLSTKTIVRSRDRLLAEGIIQRAVRIQPTAMGLYNRVVLCSLSAYGTCREDQIVEFLRRSPQVSWVDTFGGDYDLLFIVNDYDVSLINRFIDSMKSTLGSVFDRVSVLEIDSRTILRKKLLLNNGARTSLTYKNIDSVSFRGYRNNSVDRLDLNILELLSYNPHLVSSSLGERLNTAPRTIRDRCRRLREKEILLGAFYPLNWEKMGWGAACCYVELPQLDEATAKKMRIFASEHPNVWALDVYAEGSGYHYNLCLEGGSYSELYKLRVAVIKNFQPKRIDFMVLREALKTTVDAAYYSKAEGKSEF